MKLIILISLIAINTAYASSNSAISLDATIKKGADFIANILRSGKNTAQTLNNAGQQITTETENVVNKFDETGQNLKNNTNKLKGITQRHPQNAGNTLYDTRTTSNNSKQKSQPNKNYTYNDRRNSVYNKQNSSIGTVTTNQQPKKKVVIKQSQTNSNTPRQYNKTNQNFSQSRSAPNKRATNNSDNTHNNRGQKKTIVVKRR